jgi:hypothetical protein
MDKIVEKDCIYGILELMSDHNLTQEQVLYVLALYHDIEYDSISNAALINLYNKGLLSKGKVNATLFFHLKKPQQLSLDLKTELKPNGNEYTLAIADRIEKEFVIDKYLSNDERKRLADKYFKGDTTIARYFIIFKALFPVKNKKINKKWNAKFGFVHDGISLWDDSPRVAKKFIEIYKNLDIGVFLEATYRKVKDSIDFDQQKCFMTKPYKFLLAYDSYYQATIDAIKDRLNKLNSDDNTKDKLNNLKV